MKYINPSTGELVGATRFKLSQEDRDKLGNKEEVKFLDFIVTKIEAGVGFYVIELTEDSNAYEGEYILKDEDGLRAISSSSFHDTFVTVKEWGEKKGSKDTIKEYIDIDKKISGLNTEGDLGGVTNEEHENNKSER